MLGLSFVKFTYTHVAMTTLLCSISLFSIWPARAPKRGTAEFVRLSQNYTLPTTGSGRSKGGQAGMQLAAIPVTILISIICGLLTGLSNSVSAM